MKKIILITGLILISIIVFAAGNDVNTVLLLHFDDSGQFPDPDFAVGGMDSPHDVTSYDDAHINTTVKKFGVGSADFDGSGDYLTIPSSTDFNLYNTDWTIDFWFKQPTDLGTDIYTYSFLGASDSDAIYVHVDNERLYVSVRKSGSGVVNVISSPSPGDWNPSSDWHHLAIVHELSSNNYTVYADGVQYASVIDSDQVEDSSQPLYIARYVGWPYYHPGNIDEFRISKTARWTSEFTPPTEAYSEEGGPGGPEIPEFSTTTLVLTIILAGLGMALIAKKKDR